MLDSFRMYIKYVMQVVGRVSVVITLVKSLWLMAQNLKEVFSSYIVSRPLNDSEDGEATLLPLRLGSQLSPFNMVAKQVNEINMDAVVPEEIIYQSNMIGGGYAVPHPATAPAPEAAETPLTEEQFQAAAAWLRRFFISHRWLLLYYGKAEDAATAPLGVIDLRYASEVRGGEGGEGRGRRSLLPSPPTQRAIRRRPSPPTAHPTHPRSFAAAHRL
jgi:hypothetical protein